MKKDYKVVCHVCNHPEGEHWRSESFLIGSPDYGALWHCPKHRDCKKCPRGSWTDQENKSSKQEA